MISWLRRFIAVIGAIALGVGIGGLVVANSVFSSKSNLAAIHSSGTCPQIAQVAPVVMVQALAFPANSEPLLAGAISPAYVCDRLDQVLPQFEAYYRHGGASPQIDLSELYSQFKGLGISAPAPAIAVLARPITYSNPQIDQPLRNLSNASSRSVGLSLVVALAGMIIVWLIGGRKRWASLASIWLGAAIILVVEAGLIRLLPPLMASPVASSAYAALAAPVKALATITTGNASRQLLRAAGASLAVAIVFWLVSLAIGWRSRRPRRASSVTLAEQDD